MMYARTVFVILCMYRKNNADLHRRIDVGEGVGYTACEGPGEGPELLEGWHSDVLEAMVAM